MDTSRDFNSLTLDFMLGEGVRLPAPTHDDYAHALVTLGRELNRRNLLSDIIGNRPAANDPHLTRGIDGMPDEKRDEYGSRLEKLRAISIVNLDSGSGEEHAGMSIYLGHVNSRVVWMFLKGHAYRSSRQGEIIECTELDAKSMARVFSDYEEWVVPHSVGQLTLHGLANHIEREVHRKRTRLSKLASGSDLVKSVIEREQSAGRNCHDRNGDGIEG